MFICLAYCKMVCENYTDPPPCASGLYNAIFAGGDYWSYLLPSNATTTANRDTASTRAAATIMFARMSLAASG